MPDEELLTKRGETIIQLQRVIRSQNKEIEELRRFRARVTPALHKLVAMGGIASEAVNALSRGLDFTHHEERELE